MEEREFVAGSREVWERLAESVGRARKVGIARLDAASLKRMHEDYRRTAADLAYAQTHFPRSESAAYLNQLVGQAHGELYGAAPNRVGKVWAFLARDYPRLVRRYRRVIALSAAMLFGAMALGFVLSYVDYPLARVFLPEQYQEGIGDRAERGAGIGDAAAAIAPVLSAGITVNNIQVSFMAFAGGMTFGALTTWALLRNGLLLGTLAGVFTKAGLTLEFWSLIVPHGALELPAIVLAGASGLLLASALLFPGDLPRRDALRAVSGDAGRLVVGVIPLLIVAGTIEGFLTPRGFDPLLKVAFGTAVGLLFLAWVLFAGRGAEAPAEE